MHDTEIVNVYSAQNIIEAEFLKNVLADAGIESRVIGDTAVLLTGAFIQNIESVPCLWVRQSDEAQARAILADYERRHNQPHTDEPRPAWKCSACGELVEEDFDVCWNCQNPRVPE